MRPGFWQIVFVVGLCVIFFSPQLIKIIRALTGGNGAGPSAGRAAPPAARGERCHKCGAPLPANARFCPKCGTTQDVIDV